jgi:hypothetical protein
MGRYREPVLALVVVFALGACDDDRVSVLDSEVVALPAEVDFGPVWVGEMAERRIEVRNDGRASAELEVRGLAAPFEGPSRLEVRGGHSEVLAIRFRPLEAGAVERAVSLVGARGEEVELRLTGTGAEAALEVPEVLDFGGVRVGETKEATLPVGNGAPLPAPAFRVEIRGADASAFRLTRPIMELGAGATEELGIALAATALEEYRAQLVLASCGACPEERVELRGRGVETRLEAMPDPLEFTAVPPGGSSGAVLRVVNHGGYPAALEELRVEGEAFAAGAVLPAVLGEGEETEIPMTFVPPSPGDHRGWLTLADAEGEPALVVPLLGHCGGPILAADPAAIDLGRVPLGLRKGARVVVRNAGEEWPVELGTATIEGGAGWTVSPPPLPAPIEGSGLPVEIGFQGEETGTAEATLVLSAADPAWEPLRVPLRAEVADDSCQLEVFPSALRFGAINKSSWSRLEIVNTGTDRCIVWGAEVMSETEPVFSLAPFYAEDRTVGVDVDLAPGEVLSFRVGLLYTGDHAEPSVGTFRFRTSNPRNPDGRVGLSAWQMDSVPWTTCPMWEIQYQVPVGSVESEECRVRSGVRSFRVVSAYLSADSSPAFSLTMDGVGASEFRGWFGFETTFAPLTPGRHRGYLEMAVEVRDEWTSEVVALPEPLIIPLYGIAEEP